MTILDKSLDSQFNTPSYIGGPTIKVGPSWFVSHNGQDRSALQPDWYPHNYRLLAGNQAIGVYRKIVVGGGWTPPWTDYQLISSTTKSVLDPQYLTKLYGKLAEAYNDGTFNAPVFVGELGETVDMLADNVRRLANAGRAVRKGDIVGAAKALGVNAPRGGRRHKKQRGDNVQSPLDNASGRWLELRYGWRPLIKDIYSLADTIAKSQEPRKVRIRLSESSPEFKPKSNSGLYTAEGSGRKGVQLIAYIDEILPTLGDRMGLHDPASVMWELLPFSFVADWLYPVGNWLEARHIASRVSGVFVFTTREWYRTRIRARNKVPDGLRDFDYVDPWHLSWNRQIDLTRSVLTSLPAVKPPVFRNPWNGTSDRLKDSLSLAYQVFGKKFI